jgi:Flp pilus assembly protein TadG
VTVEFAIVVPLLVMVVFGITELGRALYELNTLTKATTTGARYLSRIPDAVVMNEDETPPTCSEGAAWADAAEKAENLVLYGSETEGSKTLVTEMSVSFSIESEARVVTDDSDTTAACVIIANSSAVYTSVFGDEGPIIPFTDIDTFNMYQTVEERYIGE